MTTDNTLSSYYASLAIVEGKLLEDDAEVANARNILAACLDRRDRDRADRRELHRLIAAKKKRPAKGAA